MISLPVHFNKTFLFLAFLVLFTGQALHARQTGKATCRQRSCVIDYNRSDSALFDNSNAILKEFSKDAVKNLGRTRIVFDFRECFGYRPDNDGRMVPAFWFSEPSISGDYRYRGFDLRPILKPNRVDGVLSGIPGNDSVLNRVIPVSHNQWPSEADPVLLNSLPDGLPPVDSLLFRNIRLSYNENALNAFTGREQMIDDYFAAASILDTLTEMTGKISLNDVKHFPELFVMVEEVNKILSLMSKRIVTEDLNLQEYDPLNYQKKYEAMYKYSLSMAMTFRERLHEIRLPEEKPGRDSLMSFFLAGMQRYIRWSMVVEGRNSGIYKDYLDTYFQRPAFGDDLTLIKTLFRNSFPAKNTDSLLTAVSVEIKQAYERNATKLTNESMFAEGVDLLENERQFAAQNPFMPAAMNAESSMEIAAGGIYNSYLAVAEYASNLKKYTMAGAYIQKALDYRKEHGTLHFADSSYTHVIRKLFSSRITDCDSLRSEGMYADALDCYTFIKKGYDSITRIYLTEDIAGRIGECRYHLAFQDGLLHYDKRDFIEAGRRFSECLDLRKKFSLAGDTSLDRLSKETYGYLLSGLITDAESKIWRNDLEGAVRFADSVAALVTTAPFNGDSLVRVAVEKYRKKTSLRICSNREEVAEIYCVRAWRNLELLKYAHAGQLLDSAVLMLKNYPGCRFDLRHVTDSLNKYRYPIQFQQTVARVESFYLCQNYDSVIQAYLKAQKLYAEKNIRSAGLSLDLLNEYVRSKDNRQLILSAIHYYLDSKDFRTAGQYFEMLRLQGTQAKEAGKMVLLLAYGLAESDFSTNPGADPSLKVLDYTSGSAWYSKFKFHYVYRWNELRRDKVTR